MELLTKINKARDYILSIDNSNIDLAMILGTGLGSIVEDIEDKITIKYNEIPGFPSSTVKGHAGELIIGNLMGKRVIAMNGRFHYYEGYCMEAVTFPVRVIKSLGINDIIITNAAGGMNPDYVAGDLMMITDHINLMGDNPLMGKNYDELGPRFPDMSAPFNKELQNLVRNCASELNVDIKEGIYVAVSGPNYETSAELRMLRNIGADAVGMSTIPEVIVARHMSMRVIGISCITDMALADNLQPLDHLKVVETANKAKTKFVALVKQIVDKI